MVVPEPAAAAEPPARRPVPSRRPLPVAGVVLGAAAAGGALLLHWPQELATALHALQRPRTVDASGAERVITADVQAQPGGSAADAGPVRVLPEDSVVLVECWDPYGRQVTWPDGRTSTAWLRLVGDVYVPVGAVATKTAVPQCRAESANVEPGLPTAPAVIARPAGSAAPDAGHEVRERPADGAGSMRSRLSAHNAAPHRFRKGLPHFAARLMASNDVTVSYR